MKNKITYLPILTLTFATAVSGAMLSSGGVKATQATVSSNATVTVLDACSFTSTAYTWELAANSGQSYNTEALVDTNLTKTVTCNDPSGFIIQAKGDGGSTNLTGTTTGLNIATGTTGTNSYWAFKVTSADNPAPTITTGYNSYHEVPAEETNIITYAGSTTTSVTGTFRTDYKVYVSSAQVADTYTGGVEYIIVAV